MRIEKMSFFRNIRESMARGKSSSRDATPVRSTTNNSSRPDSLISNSTGRRDSLESRHDSIYNRSDTFVLSPEQDEKKSKKSNVLSKFSTFTKRKKTPSEKGTYDHHPSDNATNTYYKWSCSDMPVNPDYDDRTDPFNFLYDRQANLKSLQKSNTTAVTPTRNTQNNNAAFDSSTFRKSKMPTQLRGHLEQLKTQSNNAAVQEEEAAQESGKYNTVTLNTFRKSFRDRFLQEQKNAAYNPAWFVEVEPLPQPENRGEANNDNNNTSEVFVYANENYRPHSRSPVRDSGERPSRSNTRSPIKRNETFRLDHAGAELPAKPSIRIEIKNSITPNLPGRFVPVGVAKPMPSTHTKLCYPKRRVATPPLHINLANPINSQNLSKIPSKNWSKQITIESTKNTQAGQPAGRYQTLVQIGREPSMKPMQSSMLIAPGHHATRIHLNGTPPPAVTKQRYLRDLNTTYPPNTSSYETSPNKNLKLNSAQLFAKPKQTYFGDAYFQTSKRPAKTAYTQFQAGNSPSANAPPFGFVLNRSMLTNKQYQQPPTYQRPTLTTSMSSTALADRHLSRRVPQQQPRVLVPTQRRSRSPIKMPWR